MRKLLFPLWSIILSSILIALKCTEGLSINNAAFKSNSFLPKIFGLGLTGTGTPQLKSSLIAIGLNDVVLADQTLVPYLFDDVSTYNFTGLVMMILFH